jgi:putative ABC transport system permease protein
LGFTAFILIGLFIQHELSWDKANDNYNRMYRVQRHFAKNRFAMDGNDISPHTRVITAQLLEKQFLEFEKISVIRENNGRFLASDPERQVYEEHGIYADSCYFGVFTYHFLEGVPKNALAEPFSMVLSKTMADKLFPGERAIGKTVMVDKKLDLKARAFTPICPIIQLSDLNILFLFPR